MREARRFLTAILLAGAALSLAAPAPAASLRADVRATSAVVGDLEAKVELMELSADRYAVWEACIRGVPVSEYGDPNRQFGYRYDERDGTGPGYRPALAVDRKSRPRKEDYLFLSFSATGNCRSDAPLPGGTAEPASVRTPPAAAASASPQTTLRRLERRARILKRAVRRLLASAARFDAWESCVSWVPVTEYGDPDGKFGYFFGGRDAITPAYRPALAIDRSAWDDPDYMFLAFVGGDRPGRTCQDEPGEAVD